MPLSLFPFFSCVHSAFEVAQQPDGFFVYKWKELHHDRGADFSFRIDPVKRIPKAGPGQAACRTAAGIFQGIDEETQSPLVDGPWMQVHVAGSSGLKCFQFAGSETADLIR